MSKTRILVLKYDKTNWDLIDSKGNFAYSYLDDEYKYIKIQRYSEKIAMPVFSYDELLERVALGNAYIDDYDNFSIMSAEVFEDTAKMISTHETSSELEVIQHVIPMDTPSGWRTIAKAVINDFLFGNTQKVNCPTCAKEQVFALIKENDEEVRMCTECRSVL